MSLGPFAVGIAVVFLLLGLAYLVNSGRGPRPGREVPPNLQPYLTDEELETTRLNRTLTAALFSSALLAVALPVYFLTESGRQADFEELFHEEAVHIGELIYMEQSPDNPEGFGCITCHGADGVGGGADFIDPRTGANVTWAAPALNDIFFRYSAPEVRFWLIWGRPGTPMPAWGIQAGGPLNTQQLDFVLAYLRSIQIPQEEALAAVDSRVNAELASLEGADASIAQSIADETGQLSAIRSAPERWKAATVLAASMESILAAAGSGLDSDFDGLSDDSEINVNRTSELAFGNVGTDATKATAAAADRLILELDPSNAFSTTDDTGEPVPDMEAAEGLLAELEAQILALEPIAANNDLLIDNAEQTLANLMSARTEARFAVDFEELAAGHFGGDVETAQRAYGLYSSYCARCHTAGYSAGWASTFEPGSGAMAPSLRTGRTEVQFPDPEDHYEFILAGSDNGRAYGVNGIGRGWMPGFGTVLSEEDLRLIVDFERSLR